MFSWNGFITILIIVSLKFVLHKRLHNW
jgi:hypothetical protein